MRLKKAERMAGEMGSKAAEMEAEMNERVKKAQEQYRCATVKCVDWRGYGIESKRVSLALMLTLVLICPTQNSRSGARPGKGGKEEAARRGNG